MRSCIPIRMPVALCLVIGLLLGTSTASAQRRGPPVDRGDFPTWDIPEEFGDDVFTFARARYHNGGGGYWRRGGQWDVDYPEADLNFSYRLQEMTSLEVDPEGTIVELTDSELFDYPFVYLIEPGNLHFRKAEIEALREYLLSGGFLMVDDFWGESEWHNFHREIQRVFPDRSLVELPVDHPVFNIVFELDEKPQIPAIGHAMRFRGTGRTWERPDAREVHIKGMFDDEDRMMMIVCHNTDLGDGWEEEARSPWYFREYSEKKAYPLGINIIFYAMTH